MEQKLDKLLGSSKTFLLQLLVSLALSSPVSLFSRYPSLFLVLSFYLAVFILSSFRYPTVRAWEKYRHNRALTYGTRMDIFLTITFAGFAVSSCRLYPLRSFTKCLLTSLKRMDPVRTRYILNVLRYVVRYLLVYVGYVSLGYTFYS